MSRQRIALCLQYDGSSFRGWQRQRRQSSVQETLETAIALLDPAASERVVAAGRTDRGVHAAAQVVHFDAMGPIPSRRWPKALNGRLPPTIRVRAASPVADDWHACFSASYRRYRYTIHNGRTPNVFLGPWSWHRHQVWLDEQAMGQALASLLGEHDFSAFQRAGSRRADAITTVQEVLVQRQGDVVVVEIQASGFLYGMVRLILGQLVAVGEGRLPLEIFVNRWRRRAREEVRDAAPPRACACCGWATRSLCSRKPFGTIVNRDSCWRAAIHLLWPLARMCLEARGLSLLQESSGALLPKASLKRSPKTTLR